MQDLEKSQKSKKARSNRTESDIDNDQSGSRVGARPWEEGEEYEKARGLISELDALVAQHRDQAGEEVHLKERALDNFQNLINEVNKMHGIEENAENSFRFEEFKAARKKKQDR